MKILCMAALFIAAFFFRTAPAVWRALEPGLELGYFSARGDSPQPDSALAILRMDTSRFHLQLLNAATTKTKKPLTAAQWRKQYKLVAAINASMFQLENPLRSVSLMMNRSYINNPRVSKDKTVLAFDPLRRGIACVQIIDRECQNFDSLRHFYGSLVQNIRMISCTGKNTWFGQSRKTSLAALGQDKKGRVLFIVCREYETVANIVETLLRIPELSILRAMYLEGGDEAQLSIGSGRFEIELGGESGLYDADGRPFRPPLPNVIGIKRR